MIVLDTHAWLWWVSAPKLTPAIAVAAAQLGRELRGDPGDRLIAATSLVRGCPLVTKDAAIRAHRGVSTIW